MKVKLLHSKHGEFVSSHYWRPMSAQENYWYYKQNGYGHRKAPEQLQKIRQVLQHSDSTKLFNMTKISCHSSTLWQKDRVLPRVVACRKRCWTRVVSCKRFCKLFPKPFFLITLGGGGGGVGGAKNRPFSRSRSEGLGRLAYINTFKTWKTITISCILFPRCFSLDLFQAVFFRFWPMGNQGQMLKG